MTKNTAPSNTNYPFTTSTSTITLLGLSRQLLLTEAFGQPNGDQYHRMGSSDERREALSSVIASVMDIIDDDELSFGDNDGSARGSRSTHSSTTTSQ